MEENNSNPNLEKNDVQETSQVSNAQEVQNTNNAEVNNTNNTNQISEKKINVCCLLSFIFSMIGIIMFGLPCGIAATVLGIVGLTTFNPQKQTAKWMGVTGLSVGAVEFVFMSMYMFM